MVLSQCIFPQLPNARLLQLWLHEYENNDIENIDNLYFVQDLMQCTEIIPSEYTIAIYSEVQKLNIVINETLKLILMFCISPCMHVYEYSHVYEPLLQ